MQPDSTILPPDRMAPHSVEAEEAVLGSVLLNSDSLFEVASFLQPDDFFIVRNSWVWEASPLARRNEQIDYVTVVEELRQQAVWTTRRRGLHHLFHQPHARLDLRRSVRPHRQRAAIRRRLLSAADRTAAHRSADINEVIDRASVALSVTERRLQRLCRSTSPSASTTTDRAPHEHRGDRLCAVRLRRPNWLLGGLQKSDHRRGASRYGKPRGC